MGVLCLLVFGLAQRRAAKIKWVRVFDYRLKRFYSLFINYFACTFDMMLYYLPSNLLR